MKGSLFAVFVLIACAPGLGGCLNTISSDGYYEPEGTRAKAKENEPGSLFKGFMQALTGTGQPISASKPQGRAPLVKPGDSTGLPDPQKTASGDDKSWSQTFGKANQSTLARPTESEVNRLRLADRTRAGANRKRHVGARDPVSTLSPEQMKRGHGIREQFRTARQGSQAVPVRRFLSEPPIEYRSHEIESEKATDSGEGEEVVKKKTKKKSRTKSKG